MPRRVQKRRIEDQENDKANQTKRSRKNQEVTGFFSHRLVGEQRLYKGRLAQKEIEMEEEEAEKTYPDKLMEYIGVKKIRLQREIEEFLRGPGTTQAGDKMANEAIQAETAESVKNEECPYILCQNKAFSKDYQSAKLAVCCDLYYHKDCLMASGYEADAELRGCEKCREGSWEVEKIEEKILIGGAKWFYKVSWKQFSSGRFDWVDEESIQQDCYQEALAEFLRSEKDEVAEQKAEQEGTREELGIREDGEKQNEVHKEELLEENGEKQEAEQEKRSGANEIHIDESINPEDTQRLDNENEFFACCGSNLKKTYKCYQCLSTSEKEGSDKKTSFFRYESNTGKMIICGDCHEDWRKHGTDFDPGVKISKAQFKLIEEAEKEDIVKCTECSSIHHGICATTDKRLKFICRTCVARRHSETRNIYKAENIPETSMSKCMEKKVNEFFKDDGVKFLIRTFACRVEYKVEEKVQLKVGLPSKMNCLSRTVYLFEQQDDVEVLLFIFETEEYDDEAVEANYRKVNINYIDSVRLISKPALKTRVFRKTVIEYLRFVKNLGYTEAHIWSAAPDDGQEYIFYDRPKHSLVQAKLNGWYRTIMKEAIDEDVIADHEDHYLLDKEYNIKDEPYFQNGYLLSNLPGILSKARSIEQANILLKKAVQERIKLDNIAKDSSLSMNYIFLLHLHQPKKKVELAKIVSETELSNNELTRNKESFRRISMYQDWKFANLQQARYSTLQFCIDWFYSDKDLVTSFKCSICEKPRPDYYCRTCKDFFICDGCYPGEHQHMLSKRTANGE